MTLAGGIIVAGDAHTEVKLTLAQVVALGMVAQPRQFEAEVGLAVAEIDYLEIAIGMDNLTTGGQAQGVGLEGDAFLKVGHVEVEVVETCVRGRWLHRDRGFVMLAK